MPKQLLTFFEKLDEPKRNFLYAGVILLFFMLDYFLFMGPLQVKPLKEISDKSKVLKEDIIKAENDIKRMNDYVKQVSDLKTEIEEINNRIKLKDETPLILEHISSIVNKESAKINQIMPDVEGERLILEDKDKKYNSLPINIELKAGYHKFGRILNQIENGKIFFNVSEFTLSSKEEAGDIDAILTLNALILEKNTENQTEKK